MDPAATGILFVIAAPSGTGKSSLARALIERVDGLEFSVSYTTRPARPGERDGTHYHFVDGERFETMVSEGAFLEWARVFGQAYGTGFEATRAGLARGSDLLLDIDVQGAAQVRRGPIPAVSAMLLPPSHADLERRLAGRGSEDAAQRGRRLREAAREAAEYRHFDYLVVNDDLERASGDLEAIVRAERRRTGRREAEARRILATFPG